MVNALKPRLPAIFVSHGGGPWPVMEGDFGIDGMWRNLAGYLKTLASSLEAKPKAILIISAHWEEAHPTVTAQAQPGLVYDYSGFPAHTYRIKYPAPGSPALAARVRQLLDDDGITSGVTTSRGLDHGVFVPLMMIYPQADIPVVALSLRRGLDAGEHIAMGKALMPLRDEGVLILGSGMTYHNLKAMMTGDPRVAEDSSRFDAWLSDAATRPDAAERNRRLVSWQQAPAALASHPRAEHLAPLFVIAGAAGEDAGHKDFADAAFGLTHSGFRFAGAQA